MYATDGTITLLSLMHQKNKRWSTTNIVEILPVNVRALPTGDALR
jgi:hypothetical protein